MPKPKTIAFISRNLNYPEVIVIFAWNFHIEIIEKLKSIIDWPVSVLVPLPEFYEETW